MFNNMLRNVLKFEKNNKANVIIFCKKVQIATSTLECNFQKNFLSAHT